MSVMNKPDYKIFAQDAKSGEYVVFPDILRGWGITLEQYNGFPPMELFNSAAKRIDEWLMYLTQRGLPEWDAVVDYPKDAMIQHAGVYYVSLKATKGEQPNNSQASWKKLTEFLGVDGKLAKDQNGADIQNKDTFIKNLGLEERLNKKVDYGNHTITGGVDSAGNGSVNAANGGIRFYRKKDGTLTLFSREAADSDSGYVTEVELPKKKGMAALTSDLTNKIDYGIHVITGGVDSAGRGSVNAANGSLRVHRDASGVITIYGREQTDDTSEYVTAAAFPRAKGEVCLDVFTFAAGGAKYRDVKIQRKNGVTYTNTLPRPILVIASYDSPATRTLAYVDGVRVAQTSHGSPSATGAWGGFVSFIVPAGSKYIVNSNGDNITLLDWVEL
ncbi:TPA: hypothetical protein ACWLTD_003290 [Morganella morganii]|uniref:hypothetical protein n=1 Tax=Morganella morganii TaxID=582 RepID=UPI000F81944F|nr:hypothetical protein [Morganella morganii]RTY32481.1 hypothetical protein EKS33_08255 [Morganella morganii subsp. morganii]HEI8864215.1 hypothetical protein [Morganella morganii]